MNEQIQATIDAEKVVTVDPMLQELVPRFLENRARDLDALQSALDDGDFPTIESLGHAMKGTGGGYGFGAISLIGQELESRAREGDGQAIRHWIGSLDRYLSKVKVVFE